MKRPLRILFALVVIGALCGFALILLSGGRSASFPPLPNPNGYDDFVKAGSLVSDTTNTPYEMEREALSQFVLTNAESLRFARLGLSRACSVPTAEALTNFNSRIDDLAGLKRLAQLLVGDGRLAEMDGRTNAAVGRYMDCIQLGNEVSRGGFVIHRLVGIACEAIGYRSLMGLLPNLSCEQIHPLIVELEKMDRTRVIWEAVWNAEKMFMLRELRKTSNPIHWVVGWWQVRAGVKSAQQKHDRIVASFRLLTTEFALRCFHSEQGRVPVRLKELVLKYLQTGPDRPG